MAEQRVARYGEWESPLSAEAMAESAHVPDEARYVDGEVWWSEPVAAENRQALCRRSVGEVEVVLPAPWNVRSGVHEYGGGAWTAVGDRVVFSHYGDHRLYRLDAPGADPVPLTPASAGFRFGGLVPGLPGTVLAVRETYTGERPTDVERDLVSVPLDGSAGEDATALVSVVSGSRFLAQARIAPDNSAVAWISWDHPAMPWQSTLLKVADLHDGTATDVRILAGGPGESVLQPEWLADGSLGFCSDRTGWWNLHRVDPAGGEPEVLVSEARETGGPLWVLNSRWYVPLDDGRLVATSTFGTDEQRLLAPEGSRVLRGDRSHTTWHDVRGSRVLVSDASALDVSSLWELDTQTGAYELVRSGADDLPRELLPPAEVVEIDGVHAVVYAPHHPGFAGPEGELPPFVAFVHGGPTAQAGVYASLGYAYYTSRGIGVVDVDYGGSTGYGRAYRERLDGQWGVVDVADVLTVVRGLAGRGIADGDRLAIEGGSAGGWTVLAALTTAETFAAGVSYFGVADAVALATDTHDFESRYLDGLIGPYPEAAEVYAERAPINHVDGLTTPVLLLQGLEDHIVPPAQARLFRDAAQQRGIPHALIEFEGEGHGFRGRHAIVASHEAALSFYGQVLGFTPPGVPHLQLER